MKPLIDAHTHIDQHDPDEWDGIVSRAQEAGVGAIIAAGVTVDSSQRCIDLAETFPDVVWAGVGVHPMDLTGPLTDDDLTRLRALSQHERVVCVSEIGLDWEPGRPDRVQQEHAFRGQLRLARDANLPVIFHNRAAGMEPLGILAEEIGTAVPAVAHYFQGPLDYAMACLAQGIYVSLAKPLLRLPDLQDIVKRHIPLDRIVLETDAFPQPFKKNRDKWTEPRDLPQVAAKVAELKGVSIETVAERTSSTMQSILGRVIGGD